MNNRFADSNLQCIITEPGLRRQVLYDGGKEVYAVSDPDGCIDEYVYEEALRRDCDGKEALLGYDAIGVFPALHTDISPRVSMLQYVLAECMRQKGLRGMRDSVDAVADAYCGAGFLGCYAYEQGVRAVYFADPSEESVSLAMRSFGFNFNYGNVRDKARRDAFTYTFVPEDGRRQAVFSVGNPDYLWRGEKIDVLLGVIQDIPGLYDVSAANPVMKFVHTASLCGAVVYLAHSALADALVRNAAKVHSAGTRSVYTDAIPLCRETLAGAVPIPVAKELQKEFEKKGLCEENGKFLHTVRVSRIAWD